MPAVCFIIDIFAYFSLILSDKHTLSNTTQAFTLSLTKTSLVYCRFDAMDHTPAAQRRLRAIHDHLSPTADDSPSHLRSNPTAGEFFSGTSSLS